MGPDPRVQGPRAADTGVDFDLSRDGRTREDWLAHLTQLFAYYPPTLCVYTSRGSAFRTHHEVRPFGCPRSSPSTVDGRFVVTLLHQENKFL